MYTSSVGNLGAVPALIVTGILTMLKHGVTTSVAASQIAAQYKEFYTMRESKVTALAIQLGRETDTPYWEWFNILRSAQRIGRPTAGNGEPPPMTPPKSQFPTTAILVAAAVGIGLLVMRR